MYIIYVIYTLLLNALYILYCKQRNVPAICCYRHPCGRGQCHVTSHNTTWRHTTPRRGKLSWGSAVYEIEWCKLSNMLPWSGPLTNMVSTAYHHTTPRDVTKPHVTSHNPTWRHTCPCNELWWERTCRELCQCTSEGGGAQCAGYSSLLSRRSGSDASSWRLRESCKRCK